MHIRNIANKIHDIIPANLTNFTRHFTRYMPLNMAWYLLNCLYTLSIAILSKYTIPEIFPKRWAQQRC